MSFDVQSILLPIVLLPIFGALINGLTGRRAEKQVVTTVAVGSVFLAFVLSTIGMSRVARRRAWAVQSSSAGPRSIMSIAEIGLIALARSNSNNCWLSSAVSCAAARRSADRLRASSGEGALFTASASDSTPAIGLRSWCAAFEINSACAAMLRET